jgi:hypothetical protein
LLVPATDVSVCLVSNGMSLVDRTFDKAHSTRSVDAMRLSYCQFLDDCVGDKSITKAGVPICS